MQTHRPRVSRLLSVAGRCVVLEGSRLADYTQSANKISTSTSCLQERLRKILQNASVSSTLPQQVTALRLLVSSAITLSIAATVYTKGVQQSAAHLTRALNDQGPMGMSTRAMLKAEQKCVGNIQTLSTTEKNKGLLRVVRNLYTLNQVSLMRSAGLELQTPDESLFQVCDNEPRELLQGMTYDPLALGQLQDRSVPSSVYLPLLGVVSLESCTNSSTKQQRFLAASEFARKFGKVVKARHKIALNQLTLFLSQDRSVSDPMQVKSTQDLTRSQRILDPAYATTQRSFSPDVGVDTPSN